MTQLIPEQIWTDRDTGVARSSIVRALERIAGSLELLSQEVCNMNDATEKVQALNETSRALENSRGGTQR